MAGVRLGKGSHRNFKLNGTQTRFWERQERREGKGS